MKTKKAVAKRIKVTSTGKMLRRVGRKNHFNAKARRVTQLRGKSARQVAGPMLREFRQALPHH